MQSVTRTEAIKNFLTLLAPQDLASLYNFDMEVQVNVAQDHGERIQKEFRGAPYFAYSDGVSTWKSFRIPYNAASKPEYTDVKMTFDLMLHAEGVGMTGWDWTNKVSRWVAFDFDAITGHSQQHKRKLTDVELRDVETAISNIEWATVRKSTSGSGLHIYVFLEEPEPTATHTEHAALARAILGQLSALTGKDLSAKIDACGQNMWVWHRKMKGTDGLTIVKQGQTLKSVPLNWRDHVDVIKGVRSKTVPPFIKDLNNTTLEQEFMELTGQRSTIPLDKDHLALIQFLSEQKDFIFAFDSDHKMMITHTCALKRAHESLGLRGIFETISEGKDSNQNCFAYPLRNGAWVVRRYSQGIEEHETWDQDKKGWTRCYFNRDPDLNTVAAMYSGVEHPQGGYVFSTGEQANKAAKALGSTVVVPIELEGRSVKLKLNKEGKLTFELDASPIDKIKDDRGWIREKSKWKAVSSISTPSRHEVEVANFDDVVRHIVDVNNTDCGWVIKPEKTWTKEPLTHVTMFLSTLGLDNREVKDVEGAAIGRSWCIVNMPFQPEYPGDRKWNRNAPQFTYPPSIFSDTLHYPTWLKILDHCGKALDEPIKDNQWCKDNGITSGRDYLKCWISSVFQNPNDPLPYLFLYSKEQNTGKSILHEALELLVTTGVVRADHALSDTVFNGELEGAIICVIEEKDLNSKKSAEAYNKIKDWVTSPLISIRRLYETPYVVANTTHWIQCSNNQNAVPVFPGDSRIVFLHVNPLPDGQEIPKKEILKLLRKEAADFLSAIMHLELPQSKERLALPVISTAEKLDAERNNMSLVDVYIKDCCFYSPGSCVKFSEFYDKFYSWLDDDQKGYWTKIRVGKELDRHKHPKGKTNTNDMMIGNISFGPVESTNHKSKYVLVGDNKLGLKPIN